MTRVARRLGDKMLDVALKTRGAGACLPENGQICGCYCRYSYCSGGRAWCKFYYKRYNCWGSCVWSSYCGTKPVGTC